MLCKRGFRADESKILELRSNGRSSKSFFVTSRGHGLLTASIRPEKVSLQVCTSGGGISISTKSSHDFVVVSKRL